MASRLTGPGPPRRATSTPGNGEARDVDVVEAASSPGVSSEAGGPSPTLRPRLISDDTIGDATGVIGMVGRHQNPDALPAECRDRVEQPDLIAEVEAGGRFVHHEDPRLLGEGAGDQHELPLAARQFGEHARGEPGDAELVEGRERDARDRAATARRTSAGAPCVP